jgi:hypothetical protein
MNAKQRNSLENPVLVDGRKREEEGAAGDSKFTVPVHNLDSKPNEQLTEREKLEIERIYRTYFG